MYSISQMHARITMMLPVLCTPSVAAFALSVGLAPSAKGQATTTRQESANRILDEAVEAYGQRQYDKAAGMLSDGVKQFPDNKDLFYWLGMTCRAQGKWDDAVEAIKRVCELDPENAEGPILLAETYMRQRKYALAVRWYEKAISLAPDRDDLKSRLEEAKKAAFAPVDELPKEAPPQPTPPSDAGETKHDPVDKSEEVASDKPTDWGNVFQCGLVGRLDSGHQGWGHFVGVVVFLMIPSIVVNQCIRHYKLPFRPAELTKTGWICGTAIVLCYLVVWGYDPHWRMVILLPLCLGIGVACYKRAKAMSMAAEKRVRTRIAGDLLRGIIRRSLDDD